MLTLREGDLEQGKEGGQPLSISCQESIWVGVESKTLLILSVNTTQMQALCSQVLDE